MIGCCGCRPFLRLAGGANGWSEQDLQDAKSALDPDISVKVLDRIRKDNTMRVQEAARHLGISARMLRHYESEGLIAPRRSANGYRRFSATELARAGWVRDLIACGFSTRELRGLVSALDNDPQKPGLNCSQVMRDKLGQIDRLVAALNQRRNALSLRLAAWEPADLERQGDPVGEGIEHPGPALSGAGALR